jgi:hypothetical protein
VFAGTAVLTSVDEKQRLPAHRIGRSTCCRRRELIDAERCIGHRTIRVATAPKCCLSIGSHHDRAHRRDPFERRGIVHQHDVGLQVPVALRRISRRGTLREKAAGPRPFRPRSIVGDLRKRRLWEYGSMTNDKSDQADVAKRGTDPGVTSWADGSRTDGDVETGDLTTETGNQEPTLDDARPGA